jgi:hypothetical protein
VQGTHAIGDTGRVQPERRELLLPGTFNSKLLVLLTRRLGGADGGS